MIPNYSILQYLPVAVPGKILQVISELDGI